jgi:CDP-2,3-bis-(O-geranylgeranyl)-sn-glycerol synthase
MSFWIPIVLALLPMYFANSSAMLFGGKTPLDLNAKAWDGKPWLGKGKTFKGTFFGVFFGTLAALLIANLVPQAVLEISSNYVLFGFFVSVGAILGDMVGSFLKRRMDWEPGKPVLLLDQLDFLAGGILLGCLFFVPTLLQIVVMVLATLIVHRFSNWIAFKAKLKEVPW